MPLGDILIYGTVVVTIVALVTYRLLGKRGKEIPDSTRLDLLPVGDEVDLAAFKMAAATPIMTNVRIIMMVLVSILILGSSLYIILSDNNDGENQKWAFGAVGSILGFWLRPEQA